MSGKMFKAIGGDPAASVTQQSAPPAPMPSGNAGAGGPSPMPFHDALSGPDPRLIEFMKQNPHVDPSLAPQLMQMRGSSMPAPSPNPPQPVDPYINMANILTKGHR